MTEPYSIRFARAADLVRLQMIEQAASQLFAQTDFAYLVDGAPIPLAALREYQAAGHSWVAVDVTDQPVGFAIIRLHPVAVHLHELDVHPEHGRRGVGLRLVQTVCDWARENGYPAVTLSTFTSIIWNAPLYAKLGFMALNEAELTPALRDIRQHEADAGLPLDQRVCMVLRGCLKTNVYLW